MFVFNPSPEFWWPVKVIEPDPDNPGKMIEREFEALFEMLGPDETEVIAKNRKEIVAKLTVDLSPEEIEAIQEELEEHDREATHRVLKGWRGIEEAPGRPMPFDDVNFRYVYKHRRIRNALVAAYLDATNDDKARLGN